MRRPVQAAATGRADLVAGLLYAAAVTALLAGCATPPPTRFHSLMSPPAAAPPRVVPAGTVAWEVLPVAVPAQVDQAQWVVRDADGGLAVLEQERWIAPLGEELRGAVSQRLTQILGPSATAAAVRERWEVRIDVQRFESTPGREARLESVWTVSSPDKAGSGLRCRGEFVQGVQSSGGYLALAMGHQRAAADMGDAIGRAVKAMSAGEAGACGA